MHLNAEIMNDLQTGMGSEETEEILEDEWGVVSKEDFEKITMRLNNGTYIIEEADIHEIGSTVVLKCKDGYENYFNKVVLESLLSHDGDILFYPVTFQAEDGDIVKINEISPPWLASDFSTPDEIPKYDI